MVLDLHVHSNCSDGQYSPERLAYLAKNAGVSVWSLTDHDTVAGTGEARRASKQLSLTFLSGIEISAKGNRQLHILGYGIRCSNPALLAACAEFQKQREERAVRLSDFLAANNVWITPDDARAFAGGAALGRPHFAMAMQQAGYVSSVSEAFDRYLGGTACSRIERRKPEPEEAIALIRGAGGIAVLAHPRLLHLSNGDLSSLLKRLAAGGLGGIECFYSLHTPEETRLYLALARQYGLTATVGSDFHGEKVKPDIHIGTGKAHSLCFRGEVMWQDS